MVVLLASHMVSLEARTMGRPLVEAQRRNDVKNSNLAQYKGAEKGPGGVFEMIGKLLPNSYFSRPPYRWPYYKQDGQGELLYGYGGQELYEYSVFKPLEGYYRRKRNVTPVMKIYVLATRDSSRDIRHIRVWTV